MLSLSNHVAILTYGLCVSHIVRVTMVVKGLGNNDHTYYINV